MVLLSELLYKSPVPLLTSLASYTQSSAMAELIWPVTTCPVRTHLGLSN